MQFLVLLIASAASLVAAQSATATAPAAGTSSCAAQQVLDTCIGTEQARINSCATTDYSCLCSTYGNLLTCYDQCPNDPGRTTVVQYQTQYCGAAKAYPSSTTSVIASAASSAVSTTATTTATSTTSGQASGSSTGTSSSSASTASSTHSGAAGLMGMNLAGGLLVVVASVFGLVL